MAGGDSDDEADATGMLADEFSQSVTELLMDAENDDLDPSEWLWGGTLGAVEGPQVEASALGEVMDWLKRNPNTPTLQERYVLLWHNVIIEALSFLTLFWWYCDTTVKISCKASWPRW